MFPEPAPLPPSHLDLAPHRRRAAELGEQLDSTLYAYRAGGLDPMIYLNDVAQMFLRVKDRLGVLVDNLQRAENTGVWHPMTHTRLLKTQDGPITTIVGPDYHNHTTVENQTRTTFDTAHMTYEKTTSLVSSQPSCSKHSSCFTMIAYGFIFAHF
jgi:hypothetical protein